MSEVRIPPRGLRALQLGREEGPDLLEVSPEPDRLYRTVRPGEGACSRPSSAAGSPASWASSFIGSPEIIEAAPRAHEESRGLIDEGPRTKWNLLGCNLRNVLSHFKRRE